MINPVDLESLYEQAQAALKAKEYARASALLRQIVAVDATYKDTSRLLANLVAQQRRRWYNDARLWGAGGVVVLVAFGILLASALPALLPATPPTPTVIALVPTATATATPTPVPSLTPTAVPSSTPTRAPTAAPFVWKRLWTGQELPRDQVRVIAFDPRDPELVYALALGSGPYKSVDGGISWQPAFSGPGPANASFLEMDPKDSRTLYYAGYEGVFKTTDAGEHWQDASAGIERLPRDGVSRYYLEMDPQNGGHLFFTNSADKLYKTTDGGNSWKQILVSKCPALWEVAVHPTESQVLFAGGFAERGCESGLWKSTDGGKSWMLVLRANRTNSVYAKRIKIDRTGKLVYWVGDDLYGSSDGGTTWKRLRQGSQTILETSPDNGAVVYAMGSDYHLMKSTNGGQTWEQKGKSLDAYSSGPRTMRMSSNGMLFFGGEDGVFVSNDDGVSWVARSNGIGARKFIVQLNPSEPPALYVGNYCGRQLNAPLYRATDSGRTWQFITDKGCSWAVAPGGNALYGLSVTGNVRRLLYSQDGGKTWTQRSRAFSGNIAVSLYGSLVYVTQPPSVYISADNGETWQEASGLAQEVSADLFFGYDKGQTVYAKGNPAYRSTDGGKIWNPCATVDVLVSESNPALAIDPLDGNHILMATIGKGVLASQDGCQSWQPTNTGLNNLFGEVVVIDPRNPSRAYAGTDSGAYVSNDGGRNWVQINDGLLGALVMYSLAIDPKDSSVYAATPYGIFKLEAR